MKYIHKICVLFFILISISTVGYSQTPDSLGLPGDNLNLYGVLSLFKESNNVDEFEKKLNTPDNKVNNLDLNHDGQIDYIRVIDYGKNGLHSLVLQDPITAAESQDLAVVEVEQQGNNNAHVQIVGDEDLYGKNYIIEPQDQQQKPTDNDTYNQSQPVIVNVWVWPSVQFMYGSSYSYWSSPWYWGYYPPWWNPWYPMGYHAYWYGMYGYRAYHRRVYENRIIAAQTIYYGHRQASTVVHNNITNHVYHGSRVSKTEVIQQNNVKPILGPRKNVSGKSNSFNANQPKQQAALRQQQFTPKQQTQTIPKEPRQQQIQQPPRQQQVMPKQQPMEPRQQPQAMPRQQSPHTNMGGGMHTGGGGGGRRK